MINRAKQQRSSNYPGDRMIAHNMALNTDIRAYYAYSFETVRGSDSGRLLDEYINLQMPNPVATFEGIGRFVNRFSEQRRSSRE